MKKIICICLLMTGLVILLAACGNQNPTPEVSYTKSGDKTYMVLSVYQLEEQVVSIPNYYQGLPVKAIGKNAFERNRTITNVTIPDSVIYIGPHAFQSCSSLASLSWGNAIKIIDNGAFQGCSSLTSIIIPDSVTTIGLGAFQDCSSLSSVTLGNAVEMIGKNAFEHCPGDIFNIYGNCKYLGTADNPYFAFIEPIDKQ